MSDVLNEIIPTFDVRSYYETVIDAPSPSVERALEGLRSDWTPPALVRMLFLVRGIRAPRGLNETLGMGFSILAEEPDEVVAGVAGRFWKVREMANMVRTPTAKAFRSWNVPGSAKGAMSIRFTPMGANRTLLSTETRVVSTDARSRRMFGLYWKLIRIPSGWIRRAMLADVKRRAEHDAVVAG